MSNNSFKGISFLLAVFVDFPLPCLFIAPCKSFISQYSIVIMSSQFIPQTTHKKWDMVFIYYLHQFHVWYYHHYITLFVLQLLTLLGVVPCRKNEYSIFLMIRNKVFHQNQWNIIAIQYSRNTILVWSKTSYW